jgi:hypothetical protein
MLVIVIKTNQVTAMNRFLVWSVYGSSGGYCPFSMSGEEMLDAESDLVSCVCQVGI